MSLAVDCCESKVGDGQAPREGVFSLMCVCSKRPKSAGGGGGGGSNGAGAGRGGSTKLGGLMASIQHEKLPPASDDSNEGDGAAAAGVGSAAGAGLSKTPRYTATVKSKSEGTATVGKNRCSFLTHNSPKYLERSLA